MRYLLIAVLMMSLFSFGKTVNAQITCVGTLYNCLPDELAYCSYDGSSFWDTIYDFGNGLIASGGSTSICCDANNSCYVTGNINSNDLCVVLDTSGDVDCNEYACVGYEDSESTSIIFTSSDSEFTCEDNVCVED